MKTVIILNGPPGCGKDTLQLAMHHRFGTDNQSMKAPMFKIARAMLGDDDFELFMKHYDDRSEKESPQAYLNNQSPRQFMIWISEGVIKPMFGNQHFGKMASDALKTGAATAVFSDGGFPDEVIRLVNDGYNVKLVRLHREGFSFDGDSRNYIHIPDIIGDNYREYDMAVIEDQVELCVEYLGAIMDD